ncbi:hypothetical protein [Tsukamurella spumae]|uniref:Uncharacterized protein n=1 Tax=Tsukamurella spumae TaxID=44753 RepID=A0A846X5L3_9ACTN|nr:hypothetical protein [Tsukamurella spumae]NKY20798.1 hypothetical protein [Tsukamurella spumae]
MGDKGDTYGALVKAWARFNWEFLTNYISVGITVVIALVVIGCWIYSKGHKAGVAEAKEELAKKKAT